jgi:hypothetical protein
VSRMKRPSASSARAGRRISRRDGPSPRRAAVSDPDGHSADGRCALDQIRCPTLNAGEAMTKPSRAGGGKPAKARSCKPSRLKRNIVPKAVAHRNAATDRIAEWLKKLGLGQYAQRFAENDISFSVLPDRKRPFGPTACQAASFWFECSAAHTQGMSWSSSEAGQRLMSRVSTSAK